MIVEEPEHAALEAWEVIHKLPFESLNPQKRNQPHQGADLEIAVIAVGQVQNVVVKAVLLVPELDAFPSIVHRLRDVHKVFKKLAGDVFIGGVFAGQLQGDGQHVQAKPTCPFFLPYGSATHGRGAETIIAPFCAQLLHTQVCHIR